MYTINLTKDEFMGECIACGGNWTAMLMSGIKNTNPELYEAIPNVKYDFFTISQLVNILCIDNEADVDSLMTCVCKDDRDVHIYWTDCLLRANIVVREPRDAAFLAFLWLFKELALRQTKLDHEEYTKQLMAITEYLKKYEQWLSNSDGWAEAPESDVADEDKTADAQADNKEYAREYLDKYLSGYVDIDNDRIWDAMLEDDSFCNYLDAAKSAYEVETLVEEYADEVIEENGISEFSNRDPYFWEH